jgi:hypothetical protein
MPNQQLMRTWYKTDRNVEEDPDYVGAFSTVFPPVNNSRQIVNVDWSVPGEVEVTYLISATS